MATALAGELFAQRQLDISVCVGGGAARIAGTDERDLHRRSLRKR
jgi:hypothetical protein